MCGETPPGAQLGASGAQPAAHVGGREAAAALREEQGALPSPARRGRAAAFEVALERSPGGLARRAPRASCRPCPSTRTSSASGSTRPRPGPRAPRPATRQSRRARTWHGRGRRAGPPRDALEQVGHLAPAEHPRQVGVALGRGHQVARVGLELAALDQVAVERAESRQLARDGRARRAALGEHAGEAAQLAVPELGRREPLRRRPLGELGEVDPVCAARALRHAAGALPGVEPAQGGRPNSLCGWWVCSSSTRRTEGSRRGNQLAAAGMTDPVSERPSAPWHQIQGPSDASTMWYAVLASRARHIHRHALHSTHRPPGLSGGAGLGGGADRPDRRGWRSGDVDRRRRPEPGRRARSRPAPPCGCSRARPRCRASRSRRCRGCRRRRRCRASAP